MRRFVVVLIAGMSLSGLAWSQTRLSVVTSLHPYYSLLEQLAGDDAEVSRLLPPGASPHTFDPTPRDVARVAGADLIVLNGGLDAWLNELVAASGQEVVTLNVLELLEVETLEASGGEAHEHGVNPHVWLDPLLMRDLVPLLTEKLVELDSENAAAYRTRSEALVEGLVALHEELEQTLLNVQGKPFVPFHDAWPYFARRYGLNLVVEIEPSPGREPSARYLAEALTLIRESGAGAIFSEVQLPARPAEVVAENAGVALYLLDPVGGTEETESYQDLLRFNAEVIARALGK